MPPLVTWEYNGRESLRATYSGLPGPETILFVGAAFGQPALVVPGLALTPPESGQVEVHAGLSTWGSAFTADIISGAEEVTSPDFTLGIPYPLTFAYDPDEWLTSAMRAVRNYTLAKLALAPSLEGVPLEVEMSFPDMQSWTKKTPLGSVLVHFELDNEDDPTLGFGVPGVSAYDDDLGTEIFSEAARHVLNFDIGIWVSAEMGGPSKRMEVRQALNNLFVPAGSRLAFNELTGGLGIVGFSGGTDILDRINDLPVWRTMEITLLVEVFSRHTPEVAKQVPLVTTQRQLLTIGDGEEILPST